MINNCVLIPEKRRRNGMGRLLLPATNNTRSRGSGDVQSERARREARVGHGAAAGAAGAGARQLPRLAPARVAAARAHARPAPQDAAIRGRHTRVFVQLSY